MTVYNRDGSVVPALADGMSVEGVSLDRGSRSPRRNYTLVGLAQDSNVSMKRTQRQWKVVWTEFRAILTYNRLLSFTAASYAL